MSTVRLLRQAMTHIGRLLYGQNFTPSSLMAVWGAFQSLAPARSVLLHIRRGVIKHRFVIRLAAAEREVDRANQVVGDGDNGFLVAAPNHHAQAFLPEDQHGANGPIHGLAAGIKYALNTPTTNPSIQYNKSNTYVAFLHNAISHIRPYPGTLYTNASFVILQLAFSWLNNRFFNI